MPIFNWDEEKNIWLQKNRNVSFEHLLSAIEDKKILKILPHPNNKYKHQILVIFEYDSYAWVAPCEYKDEIMLIKTIFPSRKATRIYFNK